MSGYQATKTTNVRWQECRGLPEAGWVPAPPLPLRPSTLERVPPLLLSRVHPRGFLGPVHLVAPPPGRPASLPQLQKPLGEGPRSPHCDQAQGGEGQFPEVRTRTKEGNQQGSLRHALGEAGSSPPSSLD